MRPATVLVLSFFMGSCSAPPDAEPEPVCGDAVCNADEACLSCPDDCGSCAATGAVPDWIGVSHGTSKFRPHTPLPSRREVKIEAARNEFEPYQIVVDGGPGGRTVRAVTASALVGPKGATIPVGASRVHRVEFYEVTSASNMEGAAGPWPDPLIPAVDPFYGEKRDALPLWVPSEERRSLWIDVHVPPDAPPGRYRGRVDLDTTGGDVTVPVDLRVFDFGLPSTSSLPTAFGMNWNDACTAHHGGYEACGADDGIEHYNTMYTRAALDHRVTLASVVYVWPRSTGDWAHFDAVYGPLLEGHADTQLVGAQLTTLRSDMAGVTGPEDIEREARARMDHVAEKGWVAQPFNYTCDEPPDGCAWSDIDERAEPIQAGGMPTLVTTDLARATTQAVVDQVDILAPLMNWVHPDGRFGDGPDYADWREKGDGRQFWWYQSCISHGCGNGCDTTPGPDYTGWPSYVIDANALQARAMEWFSFRFGVDAELYFATTYSLTSAWDDQCAFSGSGDGTLFYPGTPDRIGGQHDIPIMSIRWKMIREGLEDYEYLKRLVDLGDREWVMEQSRALFPFQGKVTAKTADDLFVVRRALAERIEMLTAE